MSALTISAVNATTDELTITAHGLNTGDGPGAMFTQAGTLPGGLAAVTDYWVIVVDANTVKLATSSSNAVAGTAIDITSAGSGTLQLLIGIPYRRATTYAAGVQVKSADLNSTEDALIALWNLLTGQAQSLFSDIVLSGGLTIGGTLKHGSRELDIDASAYVGDSSAIGTYDSTNHCLSSFTGVGLVIAPVPVRVGQRILTWKQFYNTQSSGSSLTPKLRRIDLASGTITDVWAGTGDAVGGLKSQSGTGINHTVVSGSAYFAEVTITNSTHRVHGAIVTYDRVA